MTASTIHGGDQWRPRQVFAATAYCEWEAPHHWEVQYSARAHRVRTTGQCPIPFNVSVRQQVGQLRGRFQAPEEPPNPRLAVSDSRLTRDDDRLSQAPAITKAMIRNTSTASDAWIRFRLTLLDELPQAFGERKGSCIRQGQHCSRSQLGLPTVPGRHAPRHRHRTLFRQQPTRRGARSAPCTATAPAPAARARSYAAGTMAHSHSVSATSRPTGRTNRRGKRKCERRGLCARSLSAVTSLSLGRVLSVGRPNPTLRKRLQRQS